MFRGPILLKTVAFRTAVFWTRKLLVLPNLNALFPLIAKVMAKASALFLFFAKEKNRAIASILSTLQVRKVVAAGVSGPLIFALPPFNIFSH